MKKTLKNNILVSLLSRKKDLKKNKVSFSNLRQSLNAMVWEKEHRTKLS